VAILALAVLLALAAVWALQRRLIYFPFGQAPDPATVGLAGARPVSLPTGDGNVLAGWFVPAATGPRATVLVFNGNAGNRAMRAPLARRLADGGVNVLLFDYRGYGGSSGTPTEAGLAEDARAALQYLRARDGFDSRRVIYFGESLGAAVAARLAHEHPPAALVLRSPFTSLVDVARVHYPFLPVSWLLRDRFDTLGSIASLRAPLLVIAGDRDAIVPIDQSRRLFDNAPAPKRLVIVAGADHNDPALLAGDDMLTAIFQLLSEHVH
jgi:fermentation-respiration switch protein FrsA (DUF1100 family)